VISRRQVFAVAAGAFSVLGLPRWRIDRATAQPVAAVSSATPFGVWRSNDPADLHFEYVNLAGAEGRAFFAIGPSRQFNQNGLTFNSPNSYILKGDAAQGMEPRLRAHASGDEPDARCGLGARGFDFSRWVDVSLHAAAGSAVP
jgi:microcin C transport system substrate-binding protein